MSEPQVHKYHPVGTARDLFMCRAPEVLVSGPAGTGKSRACLEKMHLAALSRPGMRGLIVRKTASSLTSTALVTFQEHVVKEAMESGEVKHYGGSTTDAAAFVYSNGSSITHGGMDKASKIMSSEYDICYVQEATELFENDWESITTRLRNGVLPYQQLLADCNPGPPHHWLKKRCDRGQTVIFNSRWQENPRLYNPRTEKWTKRGAEYVKLLNSLTGVRKLRLAEGKWAAAEGLVYDIFDPASHLMHQIDKPPAVWPRYWAVDFGFVNPFVWQDWAMKPDGQLILVQEIYRTGVTVEHHAAEILRLQKASTNICPATPQPTRPDFIVCDHDAEGRATLEEHLGMSTTPAKKNVMEGIEAVRTRMTERDPKGRPGLVIARGACRNPDEALRERGLPSSTEQEVLEYVWQDNGKDAPVKANDHGMDCMRYLVAQIDLIGKPRYRSFDPSLPSRRQMERMQGLANRRLPASNPKKIGVDETGLVGYTHR